MARQSDDPTHPNATSNLTPTSIEDLIADKTIVIPSFQRAAVWGAEQRRLLIDSLYRGFPIPPFFIWNDPVGATRWLVDGQQRRNTFLFLAQADESDLDPADGDVYFSPSDGKFHVRPESRKSDAPRIKVRDIWSSGGDFDPLSPTGYWSAGDRSNLQRVLGIMRLHVPVIMMTTEVKEHAIDLFVRLNTAGKSLSRADISVAGLVRGGREHSVVSHVRALRERLGRLGVSSVNLNHLLKAFSALSGSTVEGNFEGKSDLALGAMARQLELGIDRTISLFEEEYGLSDSSILTIGAVWPVMAIALSQVTPQELPVRRQQVAAWGALAALFGRYAASVNSRLDEDCRAAALGGNVVKALTNSLKGQLGMKPSAQFEIGGVHFDHPVQNRAVLFAVHVACYRNGTKDIMTGRKITPKVGPSEWHHIFPRASLRNLEQVAGVNRVANIALISQQSNASIGAKSANEYLPTANKLAMEQLCIPGDPKLYAKTSAAEFWEERQEMLAAAFTDFVASRLYL